jgi:hypothetical protein
LFISFLIAIFATILCFIVQASEWYIGKARRLADILFRVIPLQGSSFVILLDKTGSASRFRAEGKQIDRENVLSRGKWVQFPEGTVVRWSNSGADAGAGDLSIVSPSDDYLVYQGYQGRIQGDPIVVGHLDRGNF